MNHVDRCGDAIRTTIVEILARPIAALCKD